jgi:CrcB protein
LNKLIIYIAVGGMIGTLARYGLQQWVNRYFIYTFPYGTFAVNILGCFLIGIIYAFSEKGNVLSPEWRLFLTTGLCGGFTTFSTFSYEGMQLIRDGNFGTMIIYTVASVVLGIAAVFFGNYLIKTFA